MFNVTLLPAMFSTYRPARIGKSPNKSLPRKERGIFDSRRG
jgi:hypothetical protein